MIDLSRRPPTIVIVGTILLVAAALGLALLFPPARPSHADSRAALPAITAPRLLALYRSNIVQEVARYQNSLTVTGTVGSTGLDETGFVIVNLVDGNPAMVVAQARMMHDAWHRASQLHAGDQISVNCTASYPAGDFIGLHGCHFS